jgi:hypothetical protein
MSYYDPDQRALDKAESRRRDEEALISGRISREELQRDNGGYGMFRSSKLVRRPKAVKAATGSPARPSKPNAPPPD